jgi:hypothetical protein
MKNFIKLVRSKSVIKPIQWLESVEEIYLLLNVVATEFFSRKLRINGNQLKSIAKIYSACLNYHPSCCFCIVWGEESFCNRLLFIYIFPIHSTSKPNVLKCFDWAREKKNQINMHDTLITRPAIFKLEQIEKN